MGHSQSSPTLASRMSDLPWQDGNYKCSNTTRTYNLTLLSNMFMGADMVLVKGNTVTALGYVTPKLTAGEFGKLLDY